MIKDRVLELNDYLAIFRRRKVLILVPLLVLPVVAYLVSLAIPNTYTSQALILIEQQQVPDNFVKPVITEELNARLIHMQQQIFSRTRLQPLIERFGLYRKDVGRVPMEELVDRLRRSTIVTPVKSEIISKTGGIPGFFVYFTTDDPRIAQQVCAQIVSMFLEDNLKGREQQAEATTDFLSKQVDEAKRKLDEQDAKLADFKKHSVGQLPGQEQSSLTMLGALTSQLDAVTSTISRAQQDKSYTNSLLAQQLGTWKSSQQDSSPYALQKQLEDAQNSLVDLQARYTADHPDVLKLKKHIAELKRKLDESRAQPAATDPNSIQEVGNAEPPQIQQLRAALHQQETTIREATIEQGRLQQQLRVIQSRVQLSPVVEEQYKALTRDYQTALEFYNELLNKRNLSQMATDLERRQQGEQFQVMDPPDLPEKPTFPNRLQFAGGGLAGGLGFGLLLAFMLEHRDDTIRSDKDVEQYLKLSTLAMLPTIANGNGAAASKRFWMRKGKEKSEEHETAGVA